MCAPTGVGKSLVGAAVSDYFDTIYRNCFKKHLQDHQYIKDIPFKPVKGKQNFPCLKLMSAEKVDNPRRAMRWGLTCDMGQCQERTSKMEKR